MKRFMKSYSWCLWLGGSLSAFGIDFIDWRFYVIIVPVIIFESLKHLD